METSFFKSALIDAVLPEDTFTDINEVLQAGVEAQGESNRLLAVRERELLFFGGLSVEFTWHSLLLMSRSDERLRTLAILRLPHCEEEQLNSYLGRLAFKIDVWAIDESHNNEQTPPATAPPKDLVYTADDIQKKEPLVLASESAEGTQTLTLVWEVEITLHRPRFRVPQPSIILIPSAAVEAPATDDSAQDGDLVAFQPLEANVLEPMRFIPGFSDNPPYLAASRLERVIPVTAPQKPRIHIQHVPSRRHKAVPATMARIRYQKISNFSPVPSTIGLLDMEIIPFIHVDATVKHVELSLKNGWTESLMPGFLPMACQSGDSLTFIHRLHQNPDLNLAAGVGFTNPNVDILTIVIHLDVQLSEKCCPKLIMDWTTNVDFTQALNPSFGPPSQSIQRANRPTSLPVNNMNDANPPSMTVATSLEQTADVKARSGLSISFTAPDEPPRVGQAFTWKVLVVNNSAKVAKIAVIPLPRVQRQVTHAQSMAKRHAPKSSTASFHPSERRHARNGEDVDLAQAIVDENVVYAMHHSNSVPPEADLMALTAELRIGPLAPGQCHESVVEMVAFEAGVLRVDAMRIVDLVREIEEGGAASGVLADIRDLPDVVVVKSD
jgi:hypothetical protein